jgi:hypothetical protein
MQIEIRRTDTLRPYARNPRRNDQAVEQMVASIREFGSKFHCWCAAMAKLEAPPFQMMPEKEAA